MIGQVDEAVKLLEQWLADEPDDPIAAHMLAASTGRDVPVARVGCLCGDHL